MGNTPYKNAIVRLVKDLVDGIPPDARRTHPRTRRLAVAPFVHKDGGYGGTLGELCTGDISAELARLDTFRVLPEEGLKALLEDKDLWLSEVVRAKGGGKAPDGFDAFDLLVRGSYYVDRQALTIELRAELMDIGNGKVVGRASVVLADSDLPMALNLKELDAAKELSEALAITRDAVTRGVLIKTSHTVAERRARVRVWPAGSGSRFQAGSTLRFKVTVDRDAYVRLFNIGPDGSAVMIFPNAYHKDNFLRSGEIMTIPSGMMRFEFVVDSPFGPEAIQAVATTSRSDSEYVRTRGLPTPTEASDPFRSILGGAEALADVIREARVRSVVARPKDSSEPPPTWAEDHWTFVTEE